MCFHRFVLEVDAVEGGEDMIDKTGAPLFAVGEQIQADPFLGADAQCRRVILRFFERRAFQAKHRAAALVLREPAGARETADGRCGDGWKLHAFTSDRDFSLAIYLRRGKDKEDRDRFDKED